MDCYSSKQSTQKSNFLFLLFVYEGDYETCYVIACLYKVDYTNKKDLSNPSCSEQACAWNQGTKKEVVTKRIADLLVRKRLAYSENKNIDKIPCKKAKMKNLHAF